MWIGFVGWLWVLRRTLDGELHWGLLAAATVGYLFLMGVYAASQMTDDDEDEEQP